MLAGATGGCCEHTGVDDVSTAGGEDVEVSIGVGVSVEIAEEPERK